MCSIVEHKPKAKLHKRLNTDQSMIIMIASKETREKPNIHQLCLKKYKKTQE
jgi:hypothetical protein